ncbi:MAG: hypothetical protein AAGJ18_09740, partial [Bacteroidota bacterium]
ITTNTEDGSGFLVPFDKMPTGEVDISANIANGIQMAVTRFAGVGHDGAVYALNNPIGDPGIQKFELNATGQLVEAGFIPRGVVSNGSGTVFGFARDSKGYYSNHELNPKALQIFDLVSMNRTGEIDVADEMDAIVAKMEGVNPDSITYGMGGFMIERDGKFFTQLFFTDKAGIEVVDKTFVGIFDVATDELDKIIEWDDFVRIGYFSCLNCSYATVGDDNHLYLGSFIGNFTDPEGPNYRVLRIKSGETDFDRTWDLNGNRDFPAGENFALGSAVMNGKMYVKMFDAPVDVTWALLREKRYYAYEIDIASKTPKKIEDIPAAYWRSIHGPTNYGGKPYFIVENSELDDPNDPHQGKAYYYSYDPSTGASNLEVTVLNGQPQTIVEF